MKNQQGFFAPLMLIIVGILIVVGGIYFFLQNKKSVTTPAPVVSNMVQPPLSFDDSDLRLPVSVRILDSVNSVSSFNAIKSDAVSSADQVFFKKYFSTYSPQNLPPVVQSQNILNTYSNLLGIFNSNSNKQYQCLFELGDDCSLLGVQEVADIASLQALTSFQQKKLSDAQNIASNIVTLGRNITANADSVITLLVGWTVQKLGYNVLFTIEPKYTISSDEKSNLIVSLRQEQKKVLQYMYTDAAEEIDYITSSNNKPSRPLSSDEEDLINTYRQGSTTSPSAWNPNETKKYFYDSYKIALSNVDIGCDATSTNSVVNINFNPQDQQTENYVGKTLYSIGYGSFESMNQKRCAVENLIENF